MSFWPFSNSYGNSSHLQKFLDSVVDLSSVTVDNLLRDRELQAEFLDELKTISTKSLKSNNYSFAQSAQTENSFKAPGTNNDTSSTSSSTTESNNGGNSLSKTAREQKLLELLLQPHILSGFIDFIVLSVDFYHEAAQKANSENADLDADDVNVDSEKEDSFNTTNRYIQSAAEVLSTDLWVISNRVIEAPALMGKLWNILSLPHLYESSPSVAYLIQILDHLMETNCIEMINFIRKQTNLVDLFLGKIEIPLIMDFFLKIIQTDKADSPTGIISVLSKQKLIPRLIDILKPSPVQIAAEEGNEAQIQQELFRQTSTTEFIKALVTISSNATLAVDLDTNIGPNELTRELASDEIISTMLNDIILFQIPNKNLGRTISNKHGISNCVAILIEIIRKNNSDYDIHCGTYTPSNADTESAGEVSIQTMFHWLKDFDQNPPGPRNPIYLGGLLKLFSDNLDKLVELMEIEPDVSSSQYKLLGITNFRISELVAELLHCSNMILLNSKKIAQLISLRDKIRALQVQNIETALSETLDLSPGDSEDLADITQDISHIDLKSTKDGAGPSVSTGDDDGDDDKPDIDRLCRRMIEEIQYEDSDDEEPAVSSDNPFVCEERNKIFRDDPCIGDYFKIKFQDSKMLYKIVEKFTMFPWHNFFHNVIFDLIQQIFNGKLNSYNSFLIVELFESDQCSITNLIVNAFQHQKEPRPGYIGHLILVSEEVVKFTSLYKPSLISPVIVDAVGSKEWNWFITEILLKTRELYNVILGTDPDYPEIDTQEIGSQHQEYESDASKKPLPIILGDATNHEEFVGSQEADDPTEDADNEESAKKYTKKNNDYQYIDGDDFDAVDNDDDYSNDNNDSDDEQDDDDDTNGKNSRFKISDVHIKDMSPAREFENKDMLYEEYDGHRISLGHEKDYLHDISGSSSSEDENDCQLYRVSKHKE